MRKIISLFVSCALLATTSLTLSPPAAAETSGDFTYRILEDGTAEITGYAGTEEDLVIPSKLGDYHVTSIGEGSFYRIEGLQHVTIENGVSIIGKSAFSNCVSIEQITLPDSIISIGSRAFAACKSLSTLVIPESVKIIEEGAFYDCISLKSFQIPRSVKAIGKYAFTNCRSLTHITIPDSVTDLGESAFSQCNSLESVILGKGITAIEPNTFTSCFNLKTVQFGENIKEIRREAFLDCRHLESCTLPDGLTAIGTYAFAKCQGLTHLNIPDEVTDIGRLAFYSCHSLKSISLSDKASLGEYALLNCVRLESIVVSEGNPYYSSWDDVMFNKDKTILLHYPAMKPGATYDCPEGVLIIGEDAFSQAANLTEIYLPNTVTTIESGAFNTCPKLETISIPDSVTRIGAFSFSYSAYYKNKDNWDGNVLYIGNHLVTAENVIKGAYTIKEGTKTIADEAFSECVYLEGVILPDSVVSIGESAFFRCNSLKSVILGENVTTICDRAFNLCYSLSKFNFNDKVTTIGDAAFDGCRSLKGIVFPGTLTHIGYAAFTSCGFVSITIPANITDIGKIAFSGCKNLMSISVDTRNPSYCDVGGILFDKSKTTLIQYPQARTDQNYSVPEGIVTIDRNAFINCENLIDIAFPDTLKVIEKTAFSDCASLKSINIPDSITVIQNSAFEGCSQLQEITLPAKVIEIGAFVFYGTKYFADKSNWYKNFLYIGQHAVETNGYGTYSQFFIKPGTITIADAVFENSFSPYLFLPESIKRIGSFSFELTEYTEIGTEILYAGNEEQWNDIDRGVYNDTLSLMPIQYSYTRAIGDVNGDSEITAEDALLALQAATNCIELTPIQETFASTESDYGVTGQDALLILQYATGKLAYL